LIMCLQADCDECCADKSGLSQSLGYWHRLTHHV